MSDGKAVGGPVDVIQRVRPSTVTSPVDGSSWWTSRPGGNYTPVPNKQAPAESPGCAAQDFRQMLVAIPTVGREADAGKLAALGWPAAVSEAAAAAAPNASAVLRVALASDDNGMQLRQKLEAGIAALRSRPEAGPLLLSGLISYRRQLFEQYRHTARSSSLLRAAMRAGQATVDPVASLVATTRNDTASEDVGRGSTGDPLPTNADLADRVLARLARPGDGKPLPHADRRGPVKVAVMCQMRPHAAFDVARLLFEGEPWVEFHDAARRILPSHAGPADPFSQPSVSPAIVELATRYDAVLAARTRRPSAAAADRAAGCSMCGPQSPEPAGLDPTDPAARLSSCAGWPRPRVAASRQSAPGFARWKRGRPMRPNLKPVAPRPPQSGWGLHTLGDPFVDGLLPMTDGERDAWSDDTTTWFRSSHILHRESLDSIRLLMAVVGRSSLVMMSDDDIFLCRGALLAVEYTVAVLDQGGVRGRSGAWSTLDVAFASNGNILQNAVPPPGSRLALDLALMGRAVLFGDAPATVDVGEYAPWAAADSAPALAAPLAAAAVWAARTDGAAPNPDLAAYATYVARQYWRLPRDHLWFEFGVGAVPLLKLHQTIDWADVHRRRVVTFPHMDVLWATGRVMSRPPVKPLWLAAAGTPPVEGAPALPAQRRWGTFRYHLLRHDGQHQSTLRGETGPPQPGCFDRENRFGPLRFRSSCPGDVQPCLGAGGTTAQRSVRLPARFKWEAFLQRDIRSAIGARPWNG